MGRVAHAAVVDGEWQGAVDRARPSEPVAGLKRSICAPVVRHVQPPRADRDVMIIRTKKDIPSSDITPKAQYLDRRTFVGLGAAAVLGAETARRVLMPGELEGAMPALQEVPRGIGRPLLPAGQDPVLRSGRDDFEGVTSEQGEELNSYEEITTYNNFYEFGTDKRDPARNSGNFQPRPWTIRVEGHCNKPGDYHLEDFLKPARLEDRVYRFRCVEAWSMVIPWRGVPLADLVRAAEPTGNARYVKFETIVRPSEMPGQNRPILEWPYVEGLRIDEAMHPLSLMVTGVYGEDLPNQNGAPLRLMVPWKYGFKNVKSIVSMEFTETEPLNTWQQQNAREYGFFANVNPEVDHPRWSQARERRIGRFRRIPTQMFNGYADEVQHLYAGMDLTRYY